MRWFARSLGSALALGALGACDTEPSPRPPADSRPTGKARLLVVTHTTGFRHASIPAAEEAIIAVATASNDFEVSFARDADAVSNMLARPALDAYAGVVFANTTGNVGIPDLGAFLAWLAEGHAFLGMHAAADTYHDAPEYLAMVGAEFVTHGSVCAVRPKVEDPGHPAVAHLAPTFEVVDEIYEWKANPRPNVNVLFALDTHPPDGHPEQGQPGDFPLAWTRTHGRGRVFYTALGHGEETWRDARFRALLLGAIRWSLAR